jgi:phenylpropionate dioxygenase-like ring-hydroxylating dioxygenase large terminal subunit
MLKVLILFNLFLNCYSFLSPLHVFNEWHCIDFVKNIDIKKPYAYNIGELPLVTWFKNEEPLSTINICRHMGSKLDHGKITDNGCLICPYHGLEHNNNSTFGKSIIFQDKLWWSYNPKNKLPPAIPFYNNKNFETSFIKIDIDANLVDCAYNTMDINHPAYVHNNIFGFGSNIPPTDIKIIDYPKNKDKLGLSFNYKSNSNLVHLKRELKQSKNFHIYEYPYTTWSRVSLPNNEHLFVNVNMLPLSPNKTRWLVTLKHNYWNKSPLEKNLMAFAAECILSQDKEQLSKQAPESMLKRTIMYRENFANEEHFDKIKTMFSKYIYPDHKQVLDLYNYHKIITLINT